LRGKLEKFLNVILVILGVVVLVIISGLIVWNTIDRTNGRLISSGEERKYLLYVPKSYNPSKVVPLVINIHGFSQWPANQEEVSQWDRLADEKGFIVVYPSGTGFPKRWRVTPDADNPGAVEKEVQFFRDLIDKLSKEYAIDPTRIYASGLSNGAGMSLRLACAMPERIAAIGGVAGAYLVDLRDCAGGIPGIFFHGKADKIVPFEGGPSEQFALPFPNIATFVEDYAQLNNCNLEKKVIFNKGNVIGVRYEGCDPGAEVVFYTIADGGHTWPGGKPLPEIITGKTSKEINATRLMWDFFVEQSKNR
jgi:polyhydroxybutyrate depolymerase